jgi:AAA domain
MSTSALKRLTIEHLRGSVIPFSLLFEKGKKLTIIYGENATGKTTICDAFEFLAHGRVGSLEDRGLGKTSRYWHSLGKSASEVVVTLETGESTCTAKINKGEVYVLPVEARPRVEIRRRSQILRLIEAQPAERYAEIVRFIDVSGVESCEATLRDLIRNLGAHRETAVARVQENEDAIQQFWKTAGKPGKDAIEWAEQESTRDESALQAERTAL